MTHRFIPRLSPEEIARQQLEGLRFTVRQAFKSPQYRKRLEACGVTPDDITSLDDLRRLPTVDVEDLREGYPLPLLCVPEEEVVRIHASSGTTGKRKILAYTANDVNNFTLQMARCYEMAGLTPLDRMQVAVGYGLWTAGAGFQLGSERFGMLTIPVGPGNLEMHLQLLRDMGSTCFGATASMALLLAEEVERAGIRDKLKLRKVICGSEIRSEKMRLAIESKLGLESSYDIAGMTEMYGPGTAIDCDEHNGLHYWADMFIIEILDPETLQPVPEGEVGEMVVTSLRKEAVPLLRYRTHDLSRLLPGDCPCGLSMPRHDRILGRSDDMIIYRGVNIYPDHGRHRRLPRTGRRISCGTDPRRPLAGPHDPDRGARPGRHLRRRCPAGGRAGAASAQVPAGPRGREARRPRQPAPYLQQVQARHRPALGRWSFFEGGRGPFLKKGRPFPPQAPPIPPKNFCPDQGRSA